MCGEDEGRKAMAAEAFEDADVHSDDDEGGVDKAVAVEPVPAFVPSNRASDAMLDEAGSTSDGSLMHLEVGDVVFGAAALAISPATFFAVIQPFNHAPCSRRLMSCYRRSASTTALNPPSIASSRSSRRLC